MRYIRICFGSTEKLIGRRGGTIAKNGRVLALVCGRGDLISKDFGLLT